MIKALAIAGLASAGAFELSSLSRRDIFRVAAVAPPFADGDNKYLTYSSVPYKGAPAKVEADYKGKAIGLSLTVDDAGSAVPPGIRMGSAYNAANSVTRPGEKRGERTPGQQKAFDRLLGK